MQYIAGRTDFKLHNSVVSLGKFDGIHRGHQLLLNQVLEHKKLGFQTVMFTLLGHPSSLFSDKEIELIYTEEEKKFIIEQSGIDILISYPFTHETASMEAKTFIKEVLIDKIDAKIIIVGSDYRFGHKRQGDVELLQEMSRVFGYEVIVYDKITSEDQVISSSTIRSEIAAGNMENANLLLGKPFTIIGEVKHGRKIGQTLGFPTTNIIPPSNKLLPPNGVYASVTTHNGMQLIGVTNIGFNPTVGETPEKRVETYIFDYEGDLYGKTIEVALYAMERAEKKFNSVEELKEQMKKDIEFGREYFRTHDI